MTAKEIVVGRTKRPASEHRDHDTQFIKHYKKFLKSFHNLIDCTYFGPSGQRNWRFSDQQLEEFRNTKGGQIEVERDGRRLLKLFKRHFSPSYNDIAAHLIQQR